jgi:DNA-directed RNA polymerase specialized sigma24 family protein
LRWLVAGWSGEDLPQAALGRLLRQRRIEGGLEGYLRRILYNMAADGRRRRGAWRAGSPWPNRH